MWLPMHGWCSARWIFRQNTPPCLRTSLRVYEAAFGFWGYAPSPSHFEGGCTSPIGRHDPERLLTRPAALFVQCFDEGAHVACKPTLRTQSDAHGLREAAVVHHALDGGFRKTSQSLDVRHS